MIKKRTKCEINLRLVLYNVLYYFIEIKPTSCNLLNFNDKFGVFIFLNNIDRLYKF
jgi:hypothetical protein